MPYRRTVMWAHRERTSGGGPAGSGPQAAMPGKTTLVDQLRGERNGPPESASAAVGAEGRVPPPASLSTQSPGGPAAGKTDGLGAVAAPSSASDAPPARYNALTTMKEVTCDLPQTYSASPGTTLGNFTIRRILKTSGDKKVKKWKP